MQGKSSGGLKNKFERLFKSHTSEHYSMIKVAIFRNNPHIEVGKDEKQIYKDGRDVIAFLGFEDSTERILLNILIPVILLVVFRILAFLVLKKKVEGRQTY
jgi:hypothetical protein